MFYLSKILPLFVLPLGVAMILLFAGLIFRRRWLIVTAGAILWLASMSVISGTLFRAIEGRAERRLASEAPTADAIVVLSAGRVVAPGPAAVSEWADPDRLFGGIELYQAGKAPLLVLTGGWSPLQPNAPLESDISAKFAQVMGVPQDSIITTGRVVNTAEEARAVSDILARRPGTPVRILLVTSAFHMSRAAQLFRNAGLTVNEFPVDFAGSRSDGVSVIDFLPSAGALGQTHVAIREMYGRIYNALANRPARVQRS